MESEYNFSLGDRREIDKMGLDTFTFDKTNMFEASANSLIKKLIEENERSILEQQSFRATYNKTPRNSSEDIDYNFESKMFDYMMAHQYRDEELLVLVGMKIIYLYKFFEINVKQLLRTAFSLSSTKEFYKWDELMNFIKSKNITPSEIKSYNHLLNIKEVNNALKHHIELDAKLKEKIPEFKGQKITYKELEAFYERVKLSPLQFLKELSNAIYKELYEFDDKKIEKMAQRVVLRMDKKDALKLIDNIKSQY